MVQKRAAYPTIRFATIGHEIDFTDSWNPHGVWVCAHRTHVSGSESARVSTILKAQLGDALRTVEWA
jgi:hypothetical protein